MRRAAVVVTTVASLAAMAGAAHAEGSVTDVVATTSSVGVVTITGAGLGVLAAPNGAASSTAIGDTSSAIAGAVLTVEDATGATNGWDVTATYAPLASADLASLASALNVANAVNIGGQNIAVSSNTAGLSETNAVLGVADSGLTPNPGTLAGNSSSRTVLSVNGDGRGVTAFNTSYTLTLPAKTAVAATAYTGSVVYTVAPQAS